MKNMAPEHGKPLPLRSGEAPTIQDLPRPNRTQLSFEFDMQRDVLTKESEPLDYFLPEAYPPSEQPLKDLKPTTIKYLQLEKRHTGKSIYARTIDSAVRAAAIQTIIEDSDGLAERLAIYNIDFKTDPEEMLPEDTIIAVKEPTLTSAASGGYTIRIDHPSDLVILDPSDPSIPSKLLEGISTIKKTASEWKQEGNTAYGARKYATAVSAYSNGLRACAETELELKHDLLRNRAVANIFLGRFSQGQADGEAAVIRLNPESDDRTKALNTKAYERAGHAAYALGDYDAASRLYKQALELSSDQKESLEALKKVQERRDEQSNGGYDFERMSKSCNKKRNRLDHANFLSNTVIKDAGKHGRGLFTTKALEAGDLIICEKAFCVSFDTDPSPRSYSILNSKTRKRATGTKPGLLFSVCAKLRDDINAAKEYFKLYDGKTTDSIPEEVDGVVAVNSFRALSILDHNAIGCPTVRSSSRESQIQLTGDGYPSTGIWSRMSYINHACNGNAMRSFIGDMMIIRATRHIANGEEIFMPYLLPNIDNSVTQGQIQQIWGFKCDCELCIAETSTTTNQRKQRVQLNNKIKDLVRKQLDKDSAGLLEDLYRQTDQTFNKQRFENRPRIAMVGPGWLRCKTYHSNKSWKKLGQSSVDLLHDLGYGITFKGHDVTIDRQHCLTVPAGIDIALYAAQAFKKQDQTKIGSQFDAFAKSLWIVMYGAQRGFEDKVKELLE